MENPFCPRWCAADHSTQTDDADRWHHTVLPSVPAVELRREAHVVSLMLEIGLIRHVHGEETWVVVEAAEDPRSFWLSRESAQRLLTALQGVLSADD